jgi:phosphatidylserine/phosphatidylglycerophosphate/cardiolipin synthase-like enzyme
LSKDITGANDGRIKIIDGPENITNFMLQSYPRAKEKMDNCYDWMGPGIISTDQRIMKAALEMVNRGIKIRLLTDITKENMNYCKDLMKVSDIRHIEGIKGNFGIMDEKEYVIHLVSKESQAPSQIIYSDDRRSAEAQQFLFNLLWKNAIPIEDRIIEIEQGTNLEFIDTIRDPHEIETIFVDIITSSIKELLILFPTVNAFYRLERKGLMSLLRDIAQRGVQIKIITPMDKSLKDLSNKSNSVDNQMEMISMPSKQGINSTIVISDSKFSFVVDLKDDNKYDFTEANGLAIYSNSASSVWTHTTIFENLWTQSNIVV